MQSASRSSALALIRRTQKVKLRSQTRCISFDPLGIIGWSIEFWASQVLKTISDTTNLVDIPIFMLPHTSQKQINL